MGRKENCSDKQKLSLGSSATLKGSHKLIQLTGNFDQMLHTAFLLEAHLDASSLGI